MYMHVVMYACNVCVYVCMYIMYVQGGPKVGVQYIVFTMCILYTYFWPTLYMHVGMYVCMYVCVCMYIMYVCM